MIPKVIHADCIEYMRKLPDNSFDIILTSPPFKDEDVEGDFWEFYDSFFKECIRVCSNVCMIIFSATKMNTVIQKYPPKRTIIWSKGVVKYSWRFNPIFVYEKNDYKVNCHIWSDAFSVPPILGSDKMHKYQDPVVLYSTLLSMFDDCHSVLDPFAGSGTTGVAAMQNNMYCHLVEIDGQNISIIKDVLQSHKGQTKLEAAE